MSALRNRVQTYDSYRWAEEFITALKTTRREATVFSHGLSSVEEIENLLAKVREADRLLLLLDYDGTLVPFASKPELAAPEEELRDLLRGLANRPGTSVHLISGRTFTTLERWFGDLPIGLHAEHGFWSRSKPGAPWKPIFDAPLDWKQTVLPLLEEFVEKTPGALIEEKTAGYAWHYRLSDPEFGAMQAKELRLRLEKEKGARDLPVEILPGAKVIEVRLLGINKGVIVSGIISEDSGPQTVLAIGDDQTDEDLFAALPPGSFTLHVGPRPSRAQYRIDDSFATRSFLRRLLESGADASRSPQSATVSG